jgi:2-dehydropantoate 2-reductase
MRILVLGGGGTGGYFGGRLSHSSAVIAFLVRSARVAPLKIRGLQLRNPLGDAELRFKTVQAETVASVSDERPLDLILLSCEA